MKFTFKLTENAIKDGEQLVRFRDVEGEKTDGALTLRLRDPKHQGFKAGTLYEVEISPKQPTK